MSLYNDRSPCSFGMPGDCIVLDTYNYYLQPPSIQAVKENINNIIILYSVYNIIQASSSVQFRHFIIL